MSPLLYGVARDAFDTSAGGPADTPASRAEPRQPHSDVRQYLDPLAVERDLVGAFEQASLRFGRRHTVV